GRGADRGTAVANVRAVPRPRPDCDLGAGWRVRVRRSAHRPAGALAVEARYEIRLRRLAHRSGQPARNRSTTAGGSGVARMRAGSSLSRVAHTLVSRPSTPSSPLTDMRCVMSKLERRHPPPPRPHPTRAPPPPPP